MTTQAALASLDDIKQFIEVRSDNAEFDLRLLTLARTATRQLERYTRSEFISGARTEIFDARQMVKNNGEVLPQILRLKARPVDMGQPFTVNYDPDRAFAAATLLASTEYFYSDSKNRLYVTAAVANAVQSIQVVYTGGYAVVDPGTGGEEEDDAALDAHMSAAAPEMLKMACVTQVLFLWEKYSSGGNIGVTSLEDGGEIATGFNLAPEAMDLAAPFAHFLL